MTATYSSLSLVLLGPPGSGKTTQGRALADVYQLPLISTREMLQAEVEGDSPVGRQIERGIKRGELVNDRVMSSIILERLDRRDCRRGFILDGYPRTSSQASLLDGILAELGRTIDRVVLLDLPEDEALRRLAAVEPADAIHQRFQVWRANAPALIESYRNRSLLLEVDGSDPVDRVREAVMQAVVAPVGA